jgi:hypothetical protein
MHGGTTGFGEATFSGHWFMRIISVTLVDPMAQPKKSIPAPEPKRKGRPPKTGSDGVAHTVILPIPLAVEIERELCERTCQAMLESGNRSACSLSHWFREAVDAYLAHCAKLREAGKPIPGDSRPPASKGIQTTILLDRQLSLALAEEQFHRIAEAIQATGTRATGNLSEWFRLAAGHFLEVSRTKRAKAAKKPAAKA